MSTKRLIALITLILVRNEIASDIFIENAGFEVDSIESSNAYIYSTIIPFIIPSGWQRYDPHTNPIMVSYSACVSAPSGGSSYTDPIFGDSPPEGNQNCFLNKDTIQGDGEFGIYQELTDNVVTMNTKYTLSVWIGNPASNTWSDPKEKMDETGFGGYRVQLLANNHTLAQDDNSLTINEGRWQQSVITAIITDTNLYIGETLQIRLIHKNIGHTNWLPFSVHFDDIKLSADAITTLSNDPSQASDPTNDPSSDPTRDPSSDPTRDPSSDPTCDPSSDPTIDPYADPSVDSAHDPSSDPTDDPSSASTIDSSSDQTEGQDIVETTESIDLSHHSHVKKEYSSDEIVYTIVMVSICSIVIVCSIYLIKRTISYKKIYDATCAIANTPVLIAQTQTQKGVIGVDDNTGNIRRNPNLYENETGDIDANQTTIGNDAADAYHGVYNPRMDPSNKEGFADDNEDEDASIIDDINEMTVGRYGTSGDDKQYEFTVE